MNLCLIARGLSAFIVAGSALAGPIGSGFTSGNIRAAGFPDPLRQMTLSAVAPKSGSGGGSTGGGFDLFADRGPPVGNAYASIQIIDAPGSATVSIDGNADHWNFDGFTASWTPTPIVLEITKGVPFEITNNSGTFWWGEWTLTQPVTLEAITGSIIPATANTGYLQAGTYRITFATAAGSMNSFEAQQTVAPWYGWAGGERLYSTTVDWSLNLSDLQTYGIGRGTPETIYYVQGQSFTPSAYGSFGSPAGPPSTPDSLRLTHFFIDYASWQVPLDQLYIYTSPPTPTEAATGAGSMATGTHIGNGLYKFDNPALDYHTKYFAVLPQSADIRDGPGDFYPGGSDLFPRTDINPVRVNEGGGWFDIGFTATFAYIAGCPADINLDGFVDDSDFQQFVVGYEALLCNGPGMPGNCPANLNTDLTVDDADFIIFVAAYNELVCP